MHEIIKEKYGVEIGKPIEAPAESTDYFAFVADVEEDEIELAISQLYSKQQRADHLFLVLVTDGGDPDCAYQFAHAASLLYKHVTIFVPWRCKSAGTLICLAADELVMSWRGELGPLDVQIWKKDETDETNSGLDITAAFDALNERTLVSFEYYFQSLRKKKITTKIAANVASDLSSKTMEPIYRQLDQHRVGEVKRLLEIAIAYGDRLLSENVKPGIITYLTNDYPSHSFVIGIVEAAEHLFNNVRTPSDFETSLVDKAVNVKIGYIETPHYETQQIPNKKGNN